MNGTISQQAIFLIKDLILIGATSKKDLEDALCDGKLLKEIGAGRNETEDAYHFVRTFKGDAVDFIKNL